MKVERYQQPNLRDPDSIWIAEIMLQQTQVTDYSAVQRRSLL
ncbi:hypothetical protein [Lyngbya sp. PCC 8106]